MQDIFGNYTPGLVSLAVAVTSVGGGSGGTFYGTTAQRDAMTGMAAGDIWTISDSVPANQLSSYTGSAWT